MDDWYWLRDRHDPEVLKLLEEENKHTEAVRASWRPVENALYEAMLARVQLSDVSYPTPWGRWAYYVRTLEGHEHAISCRRQVTSGLPSTDPRADDPYEVVLLDENVLAEGHDYFEVSDVALSPDQHLLAYATDLSGGELLDIRVRDLSSAQDLSDVIEGAHHGLCFSADGGDLFYTRPDEAMRPHQIWRHRIGTPEGDDALVWHESDERFFLSVAPTKDHRFVVLSADSSATSELRLVPSDDPGAEPFVVAERLEGIMYSLEHHAGRLLVLSNEDAVNFALYEVPLEDARRERWKVLLAQRDDVRLDDLDVIDGYALVGERHDATSSLRVIPLDTSKVAPGAARVIEAPEAGVITLAGNVDFWASQVRFETTSLVEPRTLHELDPASGETTVLWRQPVPGYDPARYRTARRWAVSEDGTKVPMTLAWRADRPSAPGPCLLYGYGSYEHSVDARFSLDRPVHPLLDRSVLYAIAHVRGGGELGRRWYLDGRLENKHHSFEDFVACGRLLVEEGWTTSPQMAAAGGSAGGLLVGASMNLEPSLFGAVVAQVPFVDCLTTMLDATLPLTVTERDEWGDPLAEARAYAWIRSYSPYDNVRDDTLYPRMLVTGGLNDPRVGYFEPAKWVQKLRAADPRNAGRILLKVEMSAGHGGPSGRYRTWREWAFVLTFVLQTTGSLPGTATQALAGPDPALKTMS